MSKHNKDIFDMIDQYFSEINGEELAKTITKGVDHISKNISESIEESLKNKNYTNSTEKPKFSKYLNDTSSRLEYVREAILYNNEYEHKYVGHFKVGYEEALNDIQLSLDKYANDLDILYKRIQTQIKEIKLRTSNNKKAYVNGYISGCEYVQKAIKRSKRMMMDKIINEII